MTSFASLKKTSNSLDRLTKEIEKLNGNGGAERTEDTRFWKLERDKAGNGAAVVRFLPASEVDGDSGLPWVRVWNHGFKGPSGKWYIENSLTTIGQKDPVSEYNTVLWNASADENSPQRKQARDQKRRLQYISNILVISDPKNPENNGKVFKFKYGAKIFDKIHNCIEPPFDDMGVAKGENGYNPTNAFNPFDLWKGANFKLRCRMVAGYPNYDESSFDNSAPISDDDSKMEALWKSEHSLLEEINPSKFKSYDELKRKLEDVLELSSGSKLVESAPVAKKKPVAEVIDDEIPSFDDDLDDDDLKQFKALAEA